MLGQRSVGAPAPEPPAGLDTLAPVLRSGSPPGAAAARAVASVATMVRAAGPMLAIISTCSSKAVTSSGASVSGVGQRGDVVELGGRGSGGTTQRAAYVRRRPGAAGPPAVRVRVSRERDVGEHRGEDELGCRVHPCPADGGSGVDVQG